MPSKSPQSVISLLDLLSARSVNDKVKNIASSAADESMAKLSDKFDKQIKAVTAMLDQVKQDAQSPPSDLIMNNQDLLRQVIRDEVAGIMLTLYTKRKSWK